MEVDCVSVKQKKEEENETMTLEQHESKITELD